MRFSVQRIYPDHSRSKQEENMNNVRSFLSRYRLISSALVLVCMLAALTFSSPARADCDMQCGQGCVWWTNHGCNDCEYCCACGDDVHCDRISDSSCPCTGGLCEIE